MFVHLARDIDDCPASEVRMHARPLPVAGIQRPEQVHRLPAQHAITPWILGDHRLLCGDATSPGSPGSLNNARSRRARSTVGKGLVR